jgi:hypothetical protein
MTERYFLYALDNLAADANEIYFHPAVYADDRLLNDAERQCLIEFEALTSENVKERMQARGIKLANYFDLEQTR